MSDGVRRGLGIGALAIGALAGLTLFGTIRWSDALVCALMDQFAFGPLCVADNVLAGIGIGGAIAGVLLLWRAPPEPE